MAVRVLVPVCVVEGEGVVDLVAVRVLVDVKGEGAITAELICELLATLDTIPPGTMVEVAPVDLASFDQLCTQMAVQQ